MICYTLHLLLLALLRTYTFYVMGLSVLITPTWWPRWTNITVDRFGSAALEPALGEREFAAYGKIKVAATIASCTQQQGDGPTLAPRNDSPKGSQK